MSKPSSDRPASGEAGPDADAPSSGPTGSAADAPSGSADHTDKVGTVVDGRYRILSFVGRGGMGSVYRAEHVTIKRHVALKLLHPSLASVPEIGKRFEREAYAIGRIDHPNCVNVSDFGQLEDGSLYLVMEYLQGQSLGDLLDAEGRVAPERALRIIRHVVRGLGHAHEAGIVHRDVKPENVLLARTEDDPEFAKILDFGIAKLVGQAAEAEAGEHKLTQAGIAFGTPIYMSPEQAVGATIDGRADLYAATVLLYEMVTGRPPFYSDDKIEVMSMHTTRPPTPLSEAAPDVSLPPGLEDLVARGLAKRRDDRFRNAADLVAAIDRVIENIGSAPRAPSHPGTDVAQEVRPLRKAGRGTVPVVYGSGRHGSHPTPPPELTGAQALAGGRRRAGLVLAAVSVVAVLGIIVAVAAGGSEDERADAAPSASVDERPLAERAAKLLQRGNPQQALDLLQDNREEIREDAAALLQLGHAYAAKREHAEALDAYRAALEQDPDQITDPALETNLVVMVDQDDPDLVLQALDLLLITHLADEAAVDKLVSWATEHDDEAIRHRALDIADTHNLGGRINRVRSFALDLLYAETCEKRRGAVAKLRALGDKKAIKPLRIALERRRRSANRCLIEDAREAIKYLENLELADAGSAGD